MEAMSCLGGNCGYSVVTWTLHPGRGVWGSRALPPSPLTPLDLGPGCRSHATSQWHTREKGRLGFCPALDHSSSTQSKTSGDG